MPFFDLNNFVSCHRKNLVSGDILFDDGLHNIVPFAGTGRQAVLMDAPWNREETTQESSEKFVPIARVKHWNEFLTLVDGFGKEESKIIGYWNLHDRLLCRPCSEGQGLPVFLGGHLASEQCDSCGVALKFVPRKEDE
jgi:hypothetical protein